MARESDEELEVLARQSVEGDAAAWHRLWRLLEPRLAGMVRKSQVLCKSPQLEDEIRNVVLEVMARLQERGFRRLRLYLDERARSPVLTLMPWIGVVVRRVAIDTLRRQPDYVDRRRRAEKASTPGKWMRAGTLPPDSILPGGRPSFTRRATAREMFSHAAHVLSDAQRRSLELWLQGASAAEVAVACGLAGAADAERQIRAGLERLRRHFRSTAGGRGREG